jgi:hypothetical protein
VGKTNGDTKQNRAGFQMVDSKLRSVFFQIAIIIMTLNILAPVSTSGERIFNKYSLPKLYDGPKPDPKDNFFHLNDVFAKYNGRLYSSKGEIVKWRDTKMFRLYELARYSVVVFPYDWNQGEFEVILFSGHVRDYENLYDSIRVKYKPNSEKTIYYVNDSILFGQASNVPDGIGLDGFVVGENKLSTEKKAISLVNAAWQDKNQRKIRTDLITLGKNHMSGETKALKYFLFFEHDHLVYMNFWTEGVTKISSYSIDDPNLKILDEGEFKIVP